MDVIVISLSSPLHVGVYQNNVLIEKYENLGQTSDALPILFQEIIQKYHCQRLFFAKGPGSFMAIKITYIFLRTLSISLGIPLYAADGFTFNAQKPIKALHNLYFIKEDGEIRTIIVKEPIEQKFCLPPNLEEALFDNDTDPLYVLPAV